MFTFQFWNDKIHNYVKKKPLFYFRSIKIILGPSDAWSMRPLTQQPAYYIEDCLILDTCAIIQNIHDGCQFYPFSAITMNKPADFNCVPHVY